MKSVCIALNVTIYLTTCNFNIILLFYSNVRVVLLILMQRNEFETTEIKCIHIKINALLTSKIINSVHASITTIILLSSKT